MDLRKDVLDYCVARARRATAVAETEANILGGISKDDWHQTTEAELLIRFKGPTLDTWRQYGWNSPLSEYITEYKAQVGQCDVKIDCQKFPNMEIPRYDANIRLNHPQQQLLYYFRSYEAKELFYHVQFMVDNPIESHDFSEQTGRELREWNSLQTILEHM